MDANPRTPHAPKVGTDPRRSGRSRPLVLLAATALLLAGCAAGGGLPSPRPIVVYSGARLRPEPARMTEIDRWVTEELDNIREDPSFWIISAPQEEPSLLWEGLEISNDTARIRYQGSAADVGPVYQIYAHLHLMSTMDRQGEWLPEAPAATGFALERAILKRTSDAWLYGRSVWAFTPNAVLDELVYAVEEGYLDAYILTARPDDFEEERTAWLAANENGLETYQDWFRETFDRPPPGLRTEPESG